MINSTFAISTINVGDYIDNFNIKLKITPNMNCSVSIYLTNTTFYHYVISDVLYYNNNQITNYLVINDTYDPYWNGTININGYLSSYNPSIPVLPITNLVIFNNMSKFNVSSGYFDPLLKYYGVYPPSSLLYTYIMSTSITLDSSFNFSTDLLVNNSILNINVSSIPIRLDIQNSLLILPPNYLSIDSLALSNSTLQINDGQLIIIKQANFSGTLHISNLTGTNGTLINYGSRRGQFDSIIINNSTDKCGDYNFTYTPSSLQYLFKPRSDCTTPDDPTLEYIILGVCGGIIVIALIIIVIIFGVKWCRKRVFPHENRTALPNDNMSKTLSTKPSNYDGRRLRSYKIPNA